MFRTLTAQTLHYFARPHESIARGPIGGPAAWRGEDIAHRDDWRVTLDPSSIAELEAADEHAKRSGKATRELSGADFPLPTLAPSIARWRVQLDGGRGFVVVRGLPVDRWTPERSERVFWCLGHHLGAPGAQNPDGDLLGHVTDTGADPKARDVRQYRTAVHIPYHCDAADVVGLLCLRAARSGGQSRIVSSVAVHDALLARRPDLVERLYAPFLMDTKGEGGVDYFPITPCRFHDGHLRTFWHSEYFRTVLAYPSAQLDSVGRELLDVYDTIAAEPAMRLEMDLHPGDVQLLSNHTILHSRTEYEDHPEPARRRHLLRLWLSLPRARSPQERVQTARAYLSLARQLGGARLRRLIRGPAPRVEAP